MNGNGSDKGVIWNMVHRSPWWVPWLFLFILFAGWATYQFVHVDAVAQTNLEARQEIRRANVEFCERENQLREEVNHHAMILQDVLDVAVGQSLDTDPEFARKMMELADDIHAVEPILCEDAFPEEMEQAGYGQTAGLDRMLPQD